MPFLLGGPGETLAEYRSPRRTGVRRRGFLLENGIAHHEHVHLRAAETIERFFGAADDWLVVVE